ncbi:MAG: sigma-54 dependent transcriptional regulator [Thermodesulfobacteriota bacterium]
MKNALIIDDDKNIQTTLRIHLMSLGLATSSAMTGGEGLKAFSELRPEIVLLDLKLPDVDGLSVLDGIIKTGIRTSVVVITAYATIGTAVSAVKRGAFDYLPKPFTPAQVTHVVEMVDRINRLEAEVSSLKGIVREGDFLTRSRKMRKVLKTARQVAESSAAVLITGESGTGKGMLARLIHDWSPRVDKPFVTVDCAGLHENLLESDLFGHKRGAFTGAVRDKVGKLQTADQGTAFLDEVSEMSPAIQAKFLRFLQSREFESLGDTKVRTVDVRVIAATNKDLEELVREEAFRKDLYFRLNVVELYAPPLRERPEDILLLAEHYLKRFARLNGKAVSAIREDAAELLARYPWPGNVRELVNAMERGVILCPGSELVPESLPAHIADFSKTTHSDGDWKSLSEMERDYIRRVLSHASSMEDAAGILGIDPATLWRKRKKYHLD